MSSSVQTAILDWQCIDGIDVPISKQFGDVYFSKDNGLRESRHVFLAGNDLSTRLAQLGEYEYFSVAESGFGTGLNILALWQLWQQQRPDNHSHLHAISVEKYPLASDDLIRALAAWPELQPLAAQLIAQYPLPVTGCHRLNFPAERFSLDLWLGDAQQIFPSMVKTRAVDAWFLDGFAPACNPDIWETQVLDHIVRMSAAGSTFASFSVAGVVKRGLRKHGIQISRPRGFAHKREMLKGIWPVADAATTPTANTPSNINTPTYTTATTPRSNTAPSTPRRIAVIGAGIAGLNSAWALAQRGHQVDLFDRTAPIAGASGNPLALLNPKLSLGTHSTDHLMTLCWQYALNHYAGFNGFRALSVHQLAMKTEDQLTAAALVEHYPAGVLTQQAPQDLAFATDCDSSVKLDTSFESLQLAQAGVVSPHALSQQILAHPNIHFQVAEIVAIDPVATAIADIEQSTTPTPKHPPRYQLRFAEQQTASTTTPQQPSDATQQTSALAATVYDHVLVCCARQSQNLIKAHPQLRPIRGQVSWFKNTDQPLSMQHAYSYSGYCMQLDPTHLICGASFCPDREDDQVLLEDHVHNYELIHNAFPSYAASLPPLQHWQGRASVRAQTVDYFPLLGKVDLDSEIYSFSGLGSKGFLFAPLCSEALAALILGEHCPLSQQAMDKISPQRFVKKPRIRKPYYQGPYAKPKA